MLNKILKFFGISVPEANSSFSEDFSSGYDMLADILARATDPVRQSIDNWAKLPKELRKECVDHLDGWITPEVARDWKENGFEPHFHLFSGGMQVRNKLREVLNDAQLPSVEYAHGPMRNWDDYYMGALHELLERY